MKNFNSFSFKNNIFYGLWFLFQIDSLTYVLVYDS